MPKTEVILIQNIVGLGGESDQVKVAAGYARNYLIPQGFAVPLTGANKRRLEALKQRRAIRESDELNHMTELSRSLNKLVAIVSVKTGEDGKMFGSVTSGTIADQLKTQFDVALDKKKIHLEHPIRTLGEHEVELRLHQGVVTTLKVLVQSTTPLPEPVELPPTEKRDDRRTEKRGRRPEPAAQVEAPADKSAKDAKPAKSEKPGKGEKVDRKPRAVKGEKGGDDETA
jgi:large subunit ribosomal protein L9